MQPELLDALAGEVALVLKSALQPVLADQKALRDQIAIWESRWQDVGALRERVAAIDTKTDLTVTGLQKQVTALEQTVDRDASRLEGYSAALQRDLAGVSERVAVVETRAPVPGPAGTDGTNGAAGKDGADGLGFEDLSVEFDGERTLALTFSRGDHQKRFPITLPYLRYLGVYQDGKAYELGDVVTWAGSTWSCQEPTTMKPGESSGAKAWTLCVKKGRDGKDGRDAMTVPVVSVGGRS